MFRPVTPTVSAADLACGCGKCENKVTQQLVDAINKLHEILQSSEDPDIRIFANFNITSAYRCPEYNATPEVGGVEGSFHTLGIAADLGVADEAIAKYGSQATAQFAKVIHDVLYNTTIINNFLGYDPFTMEYPTKNFVHFDLRGGYITNPESGDPYVEEAKDAYDKSSDAQKKNFEATSSKGSEQEEQNAKIASKDGSYIVDFIRLMASVFFAQGVKPLFENPGIYSMWQILVDFASRFMYNIYCIPNLKTISGAIKALVVKPETLFAAIPSCNVILPCMKSSIMYSRNPKDEPTRLMLKTEMVTVSGHPAGTPLAVITHVKDGGLDDKNNFVKEVIEDIPSMTSKEDISDKTKWPIFQASEFEKKYGIRLDSKTGGSELLAFVMSVTDNKKLGEDDLDPAGEVLKKLAKYMLAKSRYAPRQGSATMVFNPYIVPGFTFASLEDTNRNNNEMSLYGYVTGVTHNITDRTCLTQINFNAARTDFDSVPNCYPVLESEYDVRNLEGATKVYKELFGDSITAESPETIKDKFKDLVAENTDITSAYDKIAREATTLEDYLKFIMPDTDAKVMDGEGFKYIQTNAPTETTFGFRPNVQELIKNYSKRIFKERYMLSKEDIR